MATRIFLKLGDIKGSSQDDKSHKDWVEVESFGYGVSNSVNATEKAKGNPGGEACIHSDVSMNKVIDKTSTQLYAYCSTGKVFPKAEQVPVSPLPVQGQYLDALLHDALHQNERQVRLTGPAPARYQ